MSVMTAVMGIIEDVLSNTCPHCRGKNFLRLTPDDNATCARCGSFYYVGSFYAYESEESIRIRDQRPDRFVIDFSDGRKSMLASRNRSDIPRV